MTDPRPDESQASAEIHASAPEAQRADPGGRPWRVGASLLGVFLLLLFYDSSRFQRLLLEAGLQWRTPPAGMTAPFWNAARPQAQGLLAHLTEAWSWVEAARRVTGLGFLIEAEQSLTRSAADGMKVDLSGRTIDGSAGGGELTLRASTAPAGAEPAGNTYLLVGDSMILSPLGSALGESLVARFGGRFVRRGVVGTGLSRRDYYDWPGKLEKLIALHHPDVLVVLIGINDVNASRRAGGKLDGFGSEAFLETYREHARLFLSVAQQNHVRVFWLEVPLTENNLLNDKLARINALQKEAAEEFPNTLYIPTRALLADDSGAPLPYLKLEGNRSLHPWSIDGIHLTASASRYVADHVIQEIAAAWQATPAPVPESSIEAPPKGADTIRCYRYASIALGGEQETCVMQGQTPPGAGTLLLIHPASSGDAGFDIADLVAASARRLGIAVIPLSEPQLRGADGQPRPWADRRGLTKQVLGEIRRGAERAGARGPIDGLMVIAQGSAGGSGLSLLARESLACMSLLEVRGAAPVASGRDVPRMQPMASGDGGANGRPGRLVAEPERADGEAPVARRPDSDRKGTSGIARITYRDAGKWKEQVPRLFTWHRLCQHLRDGAWPGTPREAAQALFEAIDAGLPDIVAALLERGVSTELRDARGNTALLRAVNARREPLVALLLNQGAQPDARDDEGWPALSLAVQQGNAPLARALLAGGVAVDGRDRQDRTPLMVAAWKGSVAMVELLVEAHAAIYAMDRTGESALMKAAKYNQPGTAAKLLDLGADVNQPDHSGKTPLMLAVYYGRTSVTVLLMARGANLEARDRQGWTPLMEAAQGGSAACLRLLVEHGANAAARANDQKTALIVAARAGHGAAVAFLAGLPGAVNARDRQGYSALHYAVRNGYRSVASTLLGAGTAVDQPDPQGNTALLYAVRQGDPDMAARMMRTGADPSRVNASGESPLALAKARGDARMMALLATPAKPAAGLPAASASGESGLHQGTPDKEAQAPR